MAVCNEVFSHNWNERCVLRPDAFGYIVGNAVDVGATSKSRSFGQTLNGEDEPLRHW